MNSNQKIVVGTGELLWDVLPEGRRLGGAPANFAYHATTLGNRGIIASRVGVDARGAEAVEELSNRDVETLYVQRDATHRTGSVEVALDASGQASYNIRSSVAWDFLEWSEAWQKLARETDAVCWGTLAQRAAQSRRTINSFLNATPTKALRIFDVNLRQSFFSAEVVDESLKQANVVKLNHEELPCVLNTLDLHNDNQSIKGRARALLERYELNIVCITRGANGSVIIGEHDMDEHAGFAVKVVDTIGAGDAFTAALADGLLRGLSIKEINEGANRLGAHVASQTGAMPAFDKKSSFV
ncbi:MAG: PfkB family carbohydrate kinase [Pyrinomonadaceae bacterium MAG19_C2-C3]|nr:PfkB family carbohydrate kinase [Pyrinomonadaceae bacterium MAG19_C2-C3]